MKNLDPLISIQILNWNRAEETQRAIKSAFRQTYSNIEVVLIDNGSTDNSIQLTKNNFPEVKIVELDKNYGCPGGRNRGIEHCKGEFIFYLDNDGVLHKDAVQKAYDNIKRDNSIAVVAGVVYDFDSPLEIDIDITPKSDKVYSFTNFQGGICMHRKSIYSKVGKYPEHFFYGGEEWFLTAKIIDKNFKIVKDESIILWHKRSDIARDRENELLNTYFNKLYISANLYPLLYALSFALYFPFKYYKYAKRENIQKKYCSVFFTRYFGNLKEGFTTRKAISYKAFKLLMSKRLP